MIFHRFFNSKKEITQLKILAGSTLTNDPERKDGAAWPMS